MIARQPGVGEGADEVIVVGAHFDSLPSGDDAPSAVDNGSGTIGVLTLAAVFSQFDFNRTIEYVAFGAEEQVARRKDTSPNRPQPEGADSPHSPPAHPQREKETSPHPPYIVLQ